MNHSSGEYSVIIIIIFVFVFIVFLSCLSGFNKTRLGKFDIYIRYFNFVKFLCSIDSRDVQNIRRCLCLSFFETSSFVNCKFRGIL